METDVMDIYEKLHTQQQVISMGIAINFGKGKLI